MKASHEVSNPAAKEGVRAVIAMLCGHAGLTLIAVLAGIAVPRVLGLENYGRYAAVLAVIAVVQMAHGLGLGQVELRDLGPLWHGRSTRDRAVALASTLWTVRIGLAVPAGLAAGIWVAEVGEVGSPLAVASLATLLVAFQASRSQFLARGQVGRYVGMELVRAAGAVVTVLATVLWIEGGDVFTALAVFHAAVLLGIVVLACSDLGLRLDLSAFGFVWLRLRYAFGALMAGMGGALRHNLTVPVLAVWATPADAGLFAIGLQAERMIHGPYSAARTALMPTLARLAQTAKLQEVKRWGDLMMRLSTFLCAQLLLGWTLLGGHLVRGLLGDDFTPVHHIGAILIVSSGVACVAGTCNGLLLALGSSGWVAVSTWLPVLPLAVGLRWSLTLERTVTTNVAWAYLVGAFLGSAVAWRSLETVGGIRLPMTPSFALGLPALAWAPVALAWQPPPGLALGTTLLVSALYSAFCLRTSLLPARDVRFLCSVSRPSGLRTRNELAGVAADA